MPKIKFKAPLLESDLERDVEAEFFGVPCPPSLLTAFNLVTKSELEEPAEYLLRFIRNPDYFYFTCKQIFNVELAPFQLAIMRELWFRKYPMLIGARGMSKSFMLALYSMVRALICQGSKVVIVGAAFRQAKVIFEYCVSIWRNAPVLQSLMGQSDRQGPKREVDRCTFTIGDSTIAAFPLGDGSNIRGQRANYLICDEFSTIPESIYENVVSGFASVNLSPVEQARYEARVRVLKRQGLWKEELDERGFKGNQSILSGTAYYDFNHFAKYWKRYKAIIETKGDKDALQERLGIVIDGVLDYKDYSVIRIPVELLPPGFMDEAHITRAKATIASWDYNMEYGSVFSLDSNNFFKRSLIESCVTATPINLPSGPVQFSAVTEGNSRCEYIYAIDPASEQDKFSIVILELHTDHRRIVYCWTTNRQAFKERVSKGLTESDDFYGYCARKIRSLMKTFPCIRIALDKQGGGVAVEEALHDRDKIQDGELQIWPIIDDEKPQDSDNYPGLHIIQNISFADQLWVREANHGMRKDFEDKVLLFPYFDTISLAEAYTEDSAEGRVYDTLEDCMWEIEQLKDELSTIVHTQTAGTGRDHWDTPEIKLPGKKKGRLRKDRYSSLLMGNAVARKLQRIAPNVKYESVGGFAKYMAKSKSGKFYSSGPEWFIKGVGGNNYGCSVKRGVT